MKYPNPSFSHILLPLISHEYKVGFSYPNLSPQPITEMHPTMATVYRILSMLLYNISPHSVLHAYVKDDNVSQTPYILDR